MAENRRQFDRKLALHRREVDMAQVRCFHLYQYFASLRRAHPNLRNDEAFAISRRDSCLVWIPTASLFLEVVVWTVFKVGFCMSSVD